GEARVDVEVADAGIGPRGSDRVEFRIATNRGEEPRPLRKVASGGELSRALLAVKRVLAQVGPVGTYVFDEVDSGVGGAVAEAIGRKLHEVSRHHQVLCITHLPQIAAWADQHLHVRKEAVGERTFSSVRALDELASVEELARMLGGLRVSDAARAAARELRAGARG
ncbi:MAG: DNA repair protein RecN, partial [Deltaproteobacteria bacterium]|nr:DNA repair protein RecN [Deltaproteobacteria bacterium]